MHAGMVQGAECRKFGLGAYCTVIEVRKAEAAHEHTSR